MKSEWRVSSNRINGETVYQVFRLRDIDALDHAGNREYYFGIFETPEQAQECAEYLNSKE